ncbi:tubular tail A protein [Sulfitobacter phage phiGT1]|nr:tubular tail A protein [Sulfitobacter phage phiGT1]
MTLLTLANNLARNVGLEETDQVFGSPRREMAEIIEFSNLVGEELARRVDFGALHETQTLTGDGTNNAFNLGTYFSRITSGIAVTFSSTTVRPLTRAEWGALTPVVGSPRYFLLEGRNITLWPFLATDAVVTVQAQSKAWCSNGTDEWGADTETALIDEDLMLKGLIVRWRRQKGMDFADYEAEYEADLADIARFDDRSRI